MSKIYVVTMDTFDNGQSIRNAYIIARGPFDDMETALIESEKAVKELEQLYKCLEHKSRYYYTKSLGEGVHFLMMNDNGDYIPIARYSVFEVDTKKTTSYKKTGISVSYKKGTEEQMIAKKKMKKANQYIASLRPTALTKKELNILKMEEKDND